MKFSSGDDVLIISRLNRILDALPPTVSLNAAVHQRPNTPVEGSFSESKHSEHRFDRRVF